jgi:AmmeMemoRadiSam system protein A
MKTWRNIDMTDQKEFVALPRNPYVALARATIDLYVRERKVIDVPEDLPDELVNRRAGTFVTLHKGGDLRGCIGTITPTRTTLADEIIGNAILAATEDPRFYPVRKEELSELDISVDVLGEAEEVDSFDDLDPVRYGVIVTRGYRRGLLLPNLDGIDTVEEQLLYALQILNEKTGNDRTIVTVSHDKRAIPYLGDHFLVLSHCEPYLQFCNNKTPPTSELPAPMLTERAI